SERALLRWGQPRASFWPYSGTRDAAAADYAPPDAAIAQSNCFPAALPHVPVHLDTILGLLRSRETVVVGVQLSMQFFHTGDGWLDVPDPTDIIPDAHAILLVGFHQTGPGPHDGHFIFRNSWGDGWGDQGYGYMPFEYLNLYGLRACSV